jgi:ABC-type transport system involved in multi-copper enzyme maturation permease subunit
MILEEPIIPFSRWLGDHLPDFLVTVVVLAFLGLLTGYLLYAVRYGPREAWFLTARALRGAWIDLRETSLRRVVALARLSVQEALRRGLWVALAVVVLIPLLGAAWYLRPVRDHPVRDYLGGVPAWTGLLVAFLALVLSTFSLPADVKNRTIDTVVTKPVRAWEIVLGRIIGFSVIGTMLVLVMGVVSYVFVRRGLSHRHEVPAAAMAVWGEDAGRPDAASRGPSARTSSADGQGHEVILDGEGNARTDVRKEHAHRVIAREEGPSTVYVTGPPEGMLQARVPRLGRLRFLDRAGRPSEKGINIGKEWSYRGYIEGETLAAAIWTFDRISPREFPRGLPLEMTIRVFRSHKGKIERGIRGTLVVRNPNTSVQSQEFVFTAHEFTPSPMNIPRALNVVRPDGTIQEGDLFEDLVDGGKVEVWVRCREVEQYLGMAQADLYLRAGNRWFWYNFAKRHVGIWLQMLLVCSFGVMFSTFLSGPVAFLATVFTICMGYFGQFVVDVATYKAPGGGPIESMIRIFRQMNLVTRFEEGITTTIVQGTDFVLMLVMRAVSSVMPNYGSYDTTHLVAFGYNVPGDLMAQHITATLAYVLVITCAGYFFLKAREIAA